MPVRNQNWYDLQAGRRYPLDDTSTGLDDNGNMLDDSIIVDCHIKFPTAFGEFAYIQAITISDNIVTVIIGAGQATNSIANTTIAAVSLVKPITLSKNYAVTPLIAGVAGWVVFGSGVTTNFTGRYSTPAQTQINPRNAINYATLPVTQLRKLGIAAGLSGIVNLTADAPIVVEKKTITIDAKEATALIIKTDANNNAFQFNPLEYFLGPCGQRPESGTCPKQPIETINGIAPDCAGDIKLEALGLNLYPFSVAGGLGVELPISLADTCAKPIIPREPADDCASSSSSSNSSSSGSVNTPASSSSTQSNAPNVIVNTPVAISTDISSSGTITTRYTVVATAATAIAYQWQYSDNNIGWRNLITGTSYKTGYTGSETIAGAKTSVLTITKEPNAGIPTGRIYRVVLVATNATSVVVYATPNSSSSSSSSEEPPTL